MYQLSPFSTPISQRPGVCQFCLKWVAINTQIQKTTNQYLKYPLQTHNHGMKILYVVLGTLVIISFLQKYKPINYIQVRSFSPPTSNLASGNEQRFTVQAFFFQECRWRQPQNNAKDHYPLSSQPEKSPSLILYINKQLTWDSFVVVAGRSGRLNFFWEPIAAGNGGAEKTAATQLILLIQVCISSWLLGKKHVLSTCWLSFLYLFSTPSMAF